MLISILICSLESRSFQLGRLKAFLEGQCVDKNNIEILINCDNKQKSTGQKRNELIQQAKGEYIIFIDDDDWVEEYYVDELIIACNSGADCVAINGKMTTDGGKEIKWKLSKFFENVTINHGGKPLYLRKTNHITAVRREHAIKAPFPHKSNAEDKAYSDAVVKFLITEYIISKPMYHYRFSTQNKEY